MISNENVINIIKALLCLCNKGVEPCRIRGVNGRYVDITFQNGLRNFKLLVHTELSIMYMIIDNEAGMVVEKGFIDHTLIKPKVMEFMNE